MPCWNKIETGVSLDNPDIPTLTAALTAMGFRIQTCYSGETLSATHERRRLSVPVRDGKVTMSGEVNPPVNELKRAYSVAVVQAASKRFGWNLAKKSETKFVAQRRF